MPSELLSSVVGGGGVSPFPFPQIPTPLVDDGYIYATANRIPHNGTLVDNIKCPTGFFSATSTGAWEGYLGTTLVWTVEAVDINAACTGFLAIQACWYDSVNDRLYVFGLDTTTTPDTIYTAYITLETGAVTNVGDVQLTTDFTSPTTIASVNVWRPAIDSGNFTLVSSSNTVVINESTGAEVSNVTGTTTFAGFPGHYTTLDGTARIQEILQGPDSSSGRVYITKSGQTAAISCPMPLFANIDANPLPWGDKVKINGGMSTAAIGILRTFNRSQFDAWLQEVARFGGIS